MMLRRVIPAALFCLSPALAYAQSSYIAPDGKNPVCCSNCHDTASEIYAQTS